MVARRILLLAFCLGLAAAALAADPAARRTDELMRKSGLWQQVGLAQSQVIAAIEESRERDRGPGRQPLTGPEAERIQGAARVAFSPERMRAFVRADMERLLSAGDEAEVLVWLSSPLGTRFTRLEEESDEPANYARMQREAPKYASGLPPERMARFARLEKDIQGGEGAVEMTINIAIAVAYGVASASATLDPADVEKLRARFAGQRASMLEVLTRQMVESFAWIYRSMSDDELDRYADFAETAAGRKYHAASMKALTNAFVRASLDMGERVGRAEREEPRRGL